LAAASVTSTAAAEYKPSRRRTHSSAAANGSATVNDAKYAASHHGAQP
jgi:hypothetical protein